jgi:putative ABC transport system ATP-binding protein
MEIMGLLQQLNTQHGITIILVTHETDIVPFAKRVVVLKDGQVREDSPVLGRILAPEVAQH